MGRYAFFNSDFEYKFKFGIQDSNDIRKFGGLCIDESIHKWSGDDKKYILSMLDGLNINFEKYTEDIDGTYELEQFLTNRINYTYLLGSLIYHQLLYTDELICEYEN